MKRYQGGNSNDLAEIIVDYDKKDVKIINPKNNKDLQKFNINFSLTPIFIISFIIVLMTYFVIVFDEFKIRDIFLLFNLFLFIYLFYMLFCSMNPMWHRFWQYFINDMFENKNLLIVKDINSKDWKIPDLYNFKNIKLDYNLYGDYSKYIKKVHIRPIENYYILNAFNKKERQIKYWEAIFYFKEIPKKGKMEVIFI